MPDKNIYELRSEEAQEVMNRPPALLIIWGNTIMIALLFGAAIFIDMVKVPIELKANYVCISAHTNHSKTNLALETGFVPATISDTKTVGQAHLTYQFAAHTANVNSLFHVDSVKGIKGKIYFFGSANSHWIIPNSSGIISVRNGDETLLDRLINKVKDF